MVATLARRARDTAASLDAEHVAKALWSLAALGCRGDGGVAAALCVPTPYTLHPDPTPSSLYPNPTPYTPHPQAYTLTPHPTPYTLKLIS